MEIVGYVVMWLAGTVIISYSVVAVWVWLDERKRQRRADREMERFWRGFGRRLSDD